MSDQESAVDAVVAGMVASSLAMSALPGVNTVAFIGAMGSGVVGIGAIYGYKLTKDESWKLIKQFLSAAGFATGAAFAGGKVISILLATTGMGYGAAVAIDAAVGTATAFAIGMAAKHYFKSDRNMLIAAQAFRDAKRGKTV